MLDELRIRARPLTETRSRLVGTVIAGGLLFWVLAAAILPDGAPIGVVLQGVVFGTVTALLAMGLILTYRTDRIINFAYAAMGGVGGVLAVHLFLEAGWDYFASIVAGVLVGLAVGGLTEVVVIRRFKNSSRLVLTVATIGLAQIFGGLQLYIPRWFDAEQGGLIGGLETPLSGTSFTIHPVIFNGNHFLIMAAVPPIIAGLAWFLLRTDAGVAVRAAAENRDRALLLGIPIQRLTTLVWIIAGGLAALTFILKAPFAGAVSTALGGPTLLLPALAAAVIARMESLPRAFTAGIGLGVLEQIVFWNTQKASSIDVAFLVVILVALLVQRDALSRAQEAAGGGALAETVRRIPIELRHLPEVRAFKIGGLALLGGLAIFLPRTWGITSVNLATLALIWAMVAVSLVVLTGWGGNISLGQFAIVGVGGIVAGNLVVRFNLDIFVVLAVAGVAGGLIALVVGLPALRIRGLFLAVTTLAFAVALNSYFLNPNNFPSFVQSDVNRPILWQRFDLGDQLAMYYFVLALLVLTILVATAVRGTRVGRVLIATKDNQRAASAASVPTTAVRLTGFVFSGFIAGIAGALFVLQITGAAAGTFQPAMSLDVFAMAVIGGLGSIFGAMSGVFLFKWLETVISGQARLLVTGAGLLLVLMVIPGGIIQPLMNLRDRGLRWVARQRGIHVPSLLEDKRTDEAEADEDRPADEEGIIAGALDERASEPEAADGEQGKEKVKS